MQLLSTDYALIMLQPNAVVKLTL